jgi:signal transduction histidine kinase
MKVSDRIRGGVHLPPSVKRDALLLPTLFLYNCIEFSSWHKLYLHVTTEPWLFLAWLYGLAMLIPLIWRDRAPVLVFASQWVLTVAAWPILPSYTPVVGIPVALYAVAVHRSGKVSFLALLASFIPNALDAAVPFRYTANTAVAISAVIPNSAFLLFTSGLAWGLGRLTHASQRHIRQLERERETTQEAVTAERRRIARELHDIVSHAVTVMVLQAGSAARIGETSFRQVTETGFRQVIQSLVNIETAGRQAMMELGRLLGVLDSAGLDKLGPQPGLKDLDALLGSLRDAGMLVTVHTDGTPRDLDPSVDLTAYRIVQEALTNVLRHAGTNTNPRLRLAWQAQSLYLQVDNDTNPTDTHRRRELSCGRGLVGLHERARAVGGHLHEGPQRDGYRLTATLPLADTGLPKNGQLSQ